MNLLRNPGFEEQGAESWLPAGWTVATSPALGAWRDSVAARTGGWGLGLQRYAWPPVFPPPGYEEGWAEQEARAIPGRLYEASAWCRRKSGTAVALRLSVGGQEAARQEEADDWVRCSGLVTASSDAEIYRIDLVAGAGAQAATWYVDDVALEEVSATMPRSLHGAYRALYDRVRGINGQAGGYYHDLGGRVITRLRLPNTPGAPARPYACLPVDDTGGFPEVTPGTVRVTMEVPIWVFPPSDDRDDIEEGSAADCLRWVDDLLRCVMPTDAEAPWWDFGETGITDVRLLGKDVSAERIEGFPPHVLLRVALDVIVDRASLGPA